jgi:hypothetical protein
MANGTALSTMMPEEAWKLMDQLLLGERLAAISTEMNAAIATETASLHAEDRKRGNIGYYPAEWVRLEERRADEGAAKVYQACCEVWDLQGHRKCRAFFRAVYDYALRLFLAGRRAAVIGQMQRLEQITQKYGRFQPAAASFSRALDKISQRWSRKMDVAARENEYFEERVLARSGILQPGTAIEDVPLPTRKKPKRERSPLEKKKMRIIFGALETGKKGTQYCVLLDQARLPIPDDWLIGGGPKNYLEAYRIGQPFRKRIQDEKHKYGKKMKQLAPTERAAIIQGVTRRTRQERVNVRAPEPA